MLGDMLRAERERQNLSIKDIEAGTSIRALYIECIENGDYSQLPGEVYTKGFIRNYAGYLKLDGDELVKKFVEENHPEQAEAQAALESKEEKAAAQPAKKTAQAFSSGNDFRDRVESSHKRQNILLLGVVILLAAAGAFYLFGIDSEKPAPSKVTQTQTQQAAAPKADTPAAAPAEPKKTDGVEVAAKFTDACWTEVKADGKVVYEGTLEKGKTQTWKAKKSIVITAGNAGAVELKVNGKDLGKAGDKGQVVEKTFTPEGEKPLADKKDSKEE